MIDPKEIRIGNVYNRIHGKGWTQTIINEHLLGKIFSDADAEYALNDFESIELNSHWLERCGEKCDRQDWQYQIQVGALKWYFRWNIEWYSELGGIYLDSRFQYVHQVQNLYFLLIGHELTIKSFNQSN